MKRKFSTFKTLTVALLIVGTTAIPASARSFSCSSIDVRSAMNAIMQKKSAQSCASSRQRPFESNCNYFFWSGNECDSNTKPSCVTDCDTVPPVIPEVPDKPEAPVTPELPTTPEAPGENEAPEHTASLSALEQQVVTLVNQERAKQGLPALSVRTDLSDGARLKSKDMRDSRYFDHNSPTYGTPFEMMRSLGITYSSAAENIAMGYSTAQSVMNGWMNSPGHRANILSGKYTHIGVGYVDGYWTQWFAS